MIHNAYRIVGHFRMVQNFVDGLTTVKITTAKVVIATNGLCDHVDASVVSTQRISHYIVCIIHRKCINTYSLE